jgi:hypothetical protein
MYRGVVSFTPWLLYSQGNSPHFPLYRKLGETQNQPEGCGEENILPLPGIEPWASSSQPTAIQTGLSQLIICHKDIDIYRYR